MITIVGVGALGSHLVHQIRNIKQSIQVIDFDKVETKNVQAQFYTKNCVGSHKSRMLSAVMKQSFGRNIPFIVNKLTQDNIMMLLKDSELVVDCTDNFAARTLIKEWCAQWKKDCLHGCLSADGTFARIIWSDIFTPDAEGKEGEATCENGDNLPFYSMAASHLALVIQKFLKTGKKNSLQITPTGVTWLS
jgi:molybdopterin/thiamine biosynthesis adenylyltransferase